jgi:two-component system chemotaxis response regulator CheB
VHDHQLNGCPVGLAVVGASAGGVEALKAFSAALPADLACPVVVVLHVSATATSVLPRILERAGPLPVRAAADGLVLEAGHVYVAPPNCHVLVVPGGLRLSQGPRENGHRPALDPTMRSAAQAYGGRTVGIVLSGTRDDGTAGLAAIKARGGRVLVQDPEEALYSGMPASALAHNEVDGVLRVADLAKWLADAANGHNHLEEVPPLSDAPDTTSFQGDGPSDGGTRFTCPDCGGVLFEVAEGPFVRLQCSVGHAYSPESLSAEQGRELERALWTATRALDDRAVMLDRMATRARASEHPRSAAGFAQRAQDARDHASVIRESIDRFADTLPDPEEPMTGTGAR